MVNYPETVQDFGLTEVGKIVGSVATVFIALIIGWVQFATDNLEKERKIFKIIGLNRVVLSIIWFGLSWCIGFSWSFAGNTTLSWILFGIILASIIGWVFIFPYSPIITYYIVYVAATSASLVWAEGPKKAAFCIIPFLTWTALTGSFNYYMILAKNNLVKEPPEPPKEQQMFASESNAMTIQSSSVFGRQKKKKNKCCFN